MISDKAVEAARMAVMTAMLERPGSDGYVDGHMEYARAALEAAAPYIAAEAWDAAAASIIDEHGNPIIPTNVDNPYRSQA